MEQIKIASVCGLCAGCKTAIAAAEKSVLANSKVSLFKEIVHNQNVNNRLMSLGINIKQDLSEITPNDTIIIRAHGEPPETYEYFEKNNIRYIDCTCVNVKKIHTLTQNYSKNGYSIILIGKYGKKTGITHPEILGTSGWCLTTPILIEDEDDLEKLYNINNQKFYLVCQTTFNESKADFLIEKIKQILDDKSIELVINKSICYAQKSINISSLELAKNSDLMLVVGSKKSSNTTELANNLSKVCKTIFIEDIENWKQILQDENFKVTSQTRIGITAGASTDPEELKILKLKMEGEICQTI